MVKKLLIVSLITLTAHATSGCIPAIDSYRSNLYLKKWENLAHKRHYDEAEKVLERAIRHNPENVLAWTALGDIYFATEGYREARFAYEEALRLNRDDSGAYTGLVAVALEESGCSEEIKEKAATEVEKFGSSGEKTPERLMAVFNVLNYLHDDDRAAMTAEEIMKLSPDEKTSQALSTYLSEEIIRETNAERRIEKSGRFISIFPDAKESYMVNYMRLGTVQRDLKDRDLLLSLGEGWIEREPENRRANFATAYWYTEEGIALDKAVLYLKKALDLMGTPDPADKPVFYSGSEWLKDLHKTTGTYYSTLGFAYYKLGQQEMAEDSYRKAATYLEYDKDLYFRLGNLLEERRDFEGAIMAYEQALKSGESREAQERLLPLLKNRQNTVDSDGLSGDVPLHKYFAEKEGVTSFTDVTVTAGLTGAGAIRIAWGDYNNDDYADILINGSTLFRNNRDGTFTNVTTDAGIINTPGANGGIMGDIDNDGFIDFYTFATGKGNTDRLWKNNGNNTFSDITAAAFKEPDTYPSEGAAWGDYDNDGFIDIYIANYEKPLNETIERGRCYADLLYRNNGNGTFEEVSLKAGMLLRENMCGRGVNWGDYDDDGDQDIYVSNYRLDPNFLWNNNGDGTFSNVAEEKGADGYETEGAYGHTIGSEWGDYDNDGDLDLFVSNLAHPRYIGYSDKSMLLENQGPPDYRFADRFGASGIRFEETSADPSIVDYDNDGLPDIYFTSTYKDKNSYLYKGNGDGTFKDVTWLAGVRVEDGWGNAFADYDNDGDLDMAVGGREGLRLFRNDGNDNHWIHVRVVGSRSNYSGIGARVTIMPSDTTTGMPAFSRQIREVQGGKGSGAQHSLPVEFGLGSYGGPLDIEARFPSGKISRMGSVAPDQTVVVDERTAN